MRNIPRRCGSVQRRKFSGAALSPPSGYSRRGDRSPRLCCKTVRATFAAHGFSRVWRVARAPATLLRRFLHVALPMEHLPVGRCIAAALGAGKEVVDVSPVAHLPAGSARPAAPLWLLQQSRRAWLDGRAVAEARAPGAFIAIVGRTSSLSLHVAPARRGGVTVYAWAAGSRPEVERAVFPSPIAGLAPLPTRVQMATPHPRPSSLPQPVGQLPTRLLAAHCPAVMTPSPDDRVERGDQPSLPLRPVAGGHVPDLPVLPGHRHPARCDDALVAPPCAARVWANGAPEEGDPGSACDHCQRRPEPGLARVQRHTHLTPPVCPQCLPVLDDCSVGMAHDRLSWVTCRTASSGAARARHRSFWRRRTGVVAPRCAARYLRGWRIKTRRSTVAPRLAFQCSIGRLAVSITSTRRLTS
jgi:hypothetical protein